MSDNVLVNIPWQFSAAREMEEREKVISLGCKIMNMLRGENFYTASCALKFADMHLAKFATVKEELQ